MSVRSASAVVPDAEMGVTRRSIPAGSTSVVPVPAPRNVASTRWVIASARPSRTSISADGLECMISSLVMTLIAATFIGLRPTEVNCCADAGIGRPSPTQ
jgi:hypothetical protein